MKISLAAARPGDLVACHSDGLVAKGIRLAERFRRDWDELDDSLSSEAPGDEWNHFAILDTVKGLPNMARNWTVVQAEARGVTTGASLNTVAPGGHFDILRLPDACDPARVLAFARAQVGRRYGFVTIGSILVTLFTPRFCNVMLPGTWICSALAAEALRFGGWYHDWPDVYEVSPAQLWEALAED